MENRLGEQELLVALRHFLAEDGRLKLFPAKLGMKKLACEYLATKLDSDKSYTETEVNDLLGGWTVFHDPATLRREMFDARLLERERDGSRYWVSKE